MIKRKADKSIPTVRVGVMDELELLPLVLFGSKVGLAFPSLPSFRTMSSSAILASLLPPLLFLTDLTALVG